MITLTSGQTKAIQVKFTDANDNPITLPANANIVFDITGPAALQPDPGETQRPAETSRKMLVAGAVGTGTITATYNRNEPGSVSVTEQYTVLAGPIAKGVIVVL